MKSYVKIIAAAAALAGIAAAVSKAFCDYSMKKDSGVNKLIDGLLKKSGGEALPEGEAELQARVDERKAKYTKWFTENAEDVYLLTNAGVKVHALLCKPEERSRKYVIVCHGYKDSGAGMGWPAYNFRKMGFNVLAPDGRACGRTDGSYIGMGYHESKDLRGYINFILARDAQAEIVLYGISMGAAEVMMTAGMELPDNVKAVVEDCGFTSVWDQFAYRLKVEFGLPEFPFMYMTSLYSKLFLGFDFRSASAERALRRCKIPVLFIHGSDDDYVPFSMLDRLYEAAAGDKEKLVIEGAKHARSDFVAPELYWGTIDKFVKKYIL